MGVRTVNLIFCIVLYCVAVCCSVLQYTHKALRQWAALVCCSEHIKF